MNIVVILDGLGISLNYRTWILYCESIYLSSKSRPVEGRVIRERYFCTILLPTEADRRLATMKIYYRAFLLTIYSKTLSAKKSPMNRYGVNVRVVCLCVLSARSVCSFFFRWFFASSFPQFPSRSEMIRGISNSWLGFRNKKIFWHFQESIFICQNISWNAKRTLVSRAFN